MKMKHAENVQDYITRVLDIVYRIRLLEEEVPDKVVVSKILRSLAPRFKHVVSSIIEAKDLKTLSVEVLSGSLKTHESMLALTPDDGEKKAFYAGSSEVNSFKGGRGRGRSSFRGRFRG
ncbi:uncharacterized protein LOC120253383 [Dioscorea cayenensis subsp. rotundata]|uniref:Uncharacterized protein LOC120253383 n=1 Tax=Dioscorea cayennensis subsp. rotundata TaxID=55577 RepID=A0AB40AS80_DIOCR|nr:uncharacterized protein LOC120253383 [Dioscorea cayenensis subsp. rotundata]